MGDSVDLAQGRGCRSEYGELALSNVKRTAGAVGPQPPR